MQLVPVGLPMVYGRLGRRGPPILDRRGPRATNRHDHVAAARVADDFYVLSTGMGTMESMVATIQELSADRAAQGGGKGCEEQVGAR